MSIDIKKLLPLSLKNQLWKDFFDCWSEELELFKQQIIKKKDIYRVDKLDDEKDLILLLKDFGYIPNRVLDDSLDFLRKEFKTLLHKVKNKTTYKIWNYFFRITNIKGQVYNYFYDSVKLVESVDLYKTIHINLANHLDKSKFFYGIEAVLGLNTFVNKQRILDDNDEDYSLDLDKEFVFYLDNMEIIYTTKHLSIDIFPQKLYIKNSKEYLFIEELSLFFNDIAEYNKKCVEVPHIGLTLSFIMNNSGIYNYYSNNEYSIPDFKINCATSLITAKYTPSFLAYLDTETNPQVFDADLDQEVTWFLDNEPKPLPEENIYKTFSYVCAGIGKKAFINNRFASELLDKNVLLGLWDFDNSKNNNDTKFYDYSKNNRDISIIGNNWNILLDGIISKSLNLLGIDSYGIVKDFILDSQKFSINFWISINNNQNYDIVTIIDYFFLKIDLDKIADNLIITVRDDINNVNKNISFNNYYNIDTMLTITIDNINKIAKIYINGSHVDNIDISILNSISSTRDIFVGTNNLQSNFCKMIIDDIYNYKSILSDDCINYLYVNKIGNIASSLDKEIFCEPLSVGEIKENGIIYYINTLVKANFVKNQRMFRALPNVETYSGTLTTPLPIKRGTVKIIYETQQGILIGKDDKSGYITNDALLPSLQGNINYETGEYNLTFYNNVSIVNETLGNNVSVLTAVLNNKNVIPFSVELRFRIGIQQFSVTDNGFGGWNASSGISGGSINYTTGDVIINFTSVANDISINYTFKNIKLPAEKTIVKISYKIDRILPITEIGLKNTEGHIVAYATFPDVEMRNNDHISANFFIYKE